MKVWIINHYAIPPSMGGLVRHYYFSKYLQEKGYEVKIFTSSKIHNRNINMIKSKKLYCEKKINNIPYTFLRTKDYSGNGLGRIINLLEFPFRIWQVYKKFERPDVIYTSSPDLFTAVSAVLLSKKLKVKNIVEIRDLWPQSIVEYNEISPRNIIIQILYQIEKWLYKKADKLIFTMQGGKDYIREKGWQKQVDMKKVRHINNGVDLEEFRFNKEHYQLKDKDLEDNTIFKVIYTGSIRKANQLEILVGVAKRMQSIDKSVKFLIWGEGNEKEDLIKKCEKYNLKNIIFKGWVDKKYIPFILSRADINLIHVKETNIMKYGCSSNKLFEYLASERAVLSDLKVNYNLLMKYNCGITLEKQDIALFIKKILQIKNMTEQQYHIMSVNGKQCVKKYDYKSLTLKLEKILTS